MYCGHCGAAVGEHDQFCHSCGARFVDPVAAGAARRRRRPRPPATARPLIRARRRAAAAPYRAAPAAHCSARAPSVDPTRLVPVTTGPAGRAGPPFLIGAAFALVVLAGVVAFFVLRGDEANAQPSPTGPTTPLGPSTTATTTPLPAVSTSAAPPPPTVVATSDAAPLDERAADERAAGHDRGGRHRAGEHRHDPRRTTDDGARAGDHRSGAARGRDPHRRLRRRPRTADQPHRRPRRHRSHRPRHRPTSSVRASGARASGVDSCGQPTSTHRQRRRRTAVDGVDDGR